jgi:copper oxidase (laccase) domain-containing protein
VVHRLIAAGIGEVEALNLDTYADADRFFSFRRATHRGEGDYGRQLSAIAIPG